MKSGGREEQGCVFFLVLGLVPFFASSPLFLSQGQVVYREQIKRNCRLQLVDCFVVFRNAFLLQIMASGVILTGSWGHCWPFLEGSGLTCFGSSAAMQGAIVHGVVNDWFEELMC